MICFLVLMGAETGFVRSAELSSAQFDELVKNPPFARTTFAAGAEYDEKISSLEFRAVLLDQGKYYFSFHETVNRLSYWVGLKEEGFPFFVESYDRANGSILVKYRSQVIALRLTGAKVITQASSVLESPSSPDGANRLAEDADEIRQRRSLRSPEAISRRNAGQLQRFAPHESEEKEP